MVTSQPGENNAGPEPADPDTVWVKPLDILNMSGRFPAVFVETEAAVLRPNVMFSNLDRSVTQ